MSSKRNYYVVSITAESTEVTANIHTRNTNNTPDNFLAAKLGCHRLTSDKYCRIQIETSTTANEWMLNSNVAHPFLITLRSTHNERANARMISTQLVRWPQNRPHFHIGPE